MKNFSVSPIVVLLCVLIAIMLFVALPVRTIQVAQAAQDSPAGCDPNRSVNVSGTAVVNVVPDRVLIQLGVQSNGTTPQNVEAINSATIRRVTEALHAQGIEDKDIVTDWYVIRPIYDSSDSLHIKGYRIDNVVAVTLRDIGKVNPVIVGALEAGANEVINVEFYLSDLRKYRDQARELAMKAAQEKAQDLAGAAGAETGCVMNINENTWSYYNGWWYGRDSSNLWTQNVVQNAAPSGGESALSEAGPVDLGQISVRAEVSASFGLR